MEKVKHRAIWVFWHLNVVIWSALELNNCLVSWNRRNKKRIQIEEGKNQWQHCRCWEMKWTNECRFFLLLLFLFCFYRKKFSSILIKLLPHWRFEWIEFELNEMLSVMLSGGFINFLGEKANCMDKFWEGKVLIMIGLT